jgi:uncharacterized repeat protein (TIGR01451 family)
MYARIAVPLTRIAFLLCAALHLGAQAQTCAVPQNNGTDVTTSAGQVVNGYFTPANGTYSSGSSGSISLSGGRGSTTWVTGDLALIIQMQCVDLNRDEADTYGDGVAGRPGAGYLETGSSDCKVGRYEYVPAGVGTSGSSFVPGAALQYTYVQANPTSTAPRRSFQVVRVPQYGNLTLGGQLNALAWDGLNGGVMALDVARTLAFGGNTINAAAMGFRGGGGRESTADGDNPYRHREATSVSHAAKAEGIAGTPRYVWTDDSPFDRASIAGTWSDLSAQAYVGYPGTGTTADFDFARGAPGNAGGGGQYYTGGYHNGGGGGGGNGGAGGRGAFGWRAAGWATVLSDYSNIETETGQHLAAFGGSAFGGAGVARVVMGGGGGAGDHNGNSGTLTEARGRTSGATGGGVVLIRAGALSGSGTIDARGGDGNDNPLNDASGAGAAGGSVVLVSPNWSSGSLSLDVRGGRGGDSWLGGGSAHSGGGGGGGGVIVRTGGVSASIGGGSNGITNTADAPPGGVDHGALPGNPGVNLLITEASDPVTNSGYRCLPQTDLSITKVGSTSTASVGQTVNFTLTVGNTGPQQATAATVLDTLSTGLGTLTFISASGSNGATTLTASSITGGNTFNGTVTIPAGQTLTLVLRATAASDGLRTNTAQVSPPANAADPNLSNNTASATLVVGSRADLSAAKAVNTPTLALGGTTTFTLTYANLGPDTATGANVTDTLPLQMGTLTFVSASGAAGATLTSSSVTGNTFNGTVTLPASSTLTVVLRAVAGTTAVVINTTTIAPPATVTDANPSNNMGTAQVAIGPQADLSITKSATPAVVNQDQTTTFTVTVVNAGPNAATGATVNDTLPSGLSGMTLTGVTTAGGGTLTLSATSSSQFNGTLTLPAGSTVSLSLRAIAGGVGVQVNNASVTAPASVIDTNPANNTAQATVTIPLPANLQVDKTNGVSALGSGNTTSYTITVSNLGPNAADGSTLADAAVAGLSCTSVTCAGATGGAICPGSPAIAALQGAGLNLSTLPANSTLTFVVTCTVTATGLP